MAASTQHMAIMVLMDIIIVVMDLEEVDGTQQLGSDSQETIKMSLLPMENLEKIPAGIGRTTSLYYDAWPYKGLLR